MTPPFSVTGIDHLVLRVADLARARHFYEDILGCRLERELPEYGLYQFRAGASLIDLVVIGSKLGGTAPADPAAANQDHFCLTLSTFDEGALRDYLEAHGIRCSATADRYGAGGTGPSFYIRDPDGNSVELKGAV